MQKITGSNPAYTGPTNHSDRAVWFIDGITYVPDGHPYAAYAERVDGYTVETVPEVPAAYTAAVAAIKASGVHHQGGRLRDAAVDPQPGDASAPTNAGQPGALGNPHGPHVVAPQALTRHAQAKTEQAGQVTP